MSENKFTEHMEVEKIGTLKPGDIGWGTCDGCPKNIHKFPGVLIQGITQEAALLLFQKVEIVPAGTKARLEKLEDSSAGLLKALEYLIDECEQVEDYEHIDWRIMAKAREEAHKARGLQQ